jgi:hypothetical protein
MFCPGSQEELPSCGPFYFWSQMSKINSAEPRASASGGFASSTHSSASVPAADVASPVPQDFSRITPAQLAANRANAQLSTGPRTSTGKARASKNAVKSGLTGRTVLLPSDDVDEYAAFLAEWQHDLAPVGQAECELVQSIADCHWRMRRIRALEFALYAHGHSQFEDMFAEEPEEVRYNMILLQTDMTYEKQFRNYQIQEARLHRRRDKDMAELLRLQAERKANQPEDEDFSDVDALFAAHAAKAQRTAPPALPANGFEFSTTASTPDTAASTPAGTGTTEAVAA